MSIAQPQIDRRPSPGFAPTNPFASNNPFRNRVSASSPDLPSPSIRQSRNPFLDVFADDDQDIFSDGRSTNPVQATSPRPPQPQVPRNEPENLLINFSLDDTDTQPAQPPRRPSPSMNTENRSRGPQPRPMNGPPRPPVRGAPAPSPHHAHNGSTGSSSAKYPAANGRARVKEEGRASGRQRSNSESSAIDVLDREREKEKERERRREKSKRDGDDKSKDKDKDEKSKKSSSERRKRGAAGVDLIDKLDVTGIYGGGLFHHDGPFDACNPHRNKNKNRAPMHAFPEGSKNNAIAGFDFDLKPNDHSNLFGNRDPEAYLEFSSGRRASAVDGLEDLSRPIGKRAQSFDPVSRTVIHGDESLGLGTSTFLEGAPAAKKAIEKAQAEEEVLRPTTSGAFKDSSGLQRKKSLAQKFRGKGSQKISAGEGAERIAPGFDRRHKPSKSNSPTNEDYPTRPFTPTSPPRGGPPPVNRAAKGSVSQPRENFGDDYDSAWDRKGERIQVAEDERKYRDRAPSHPGLGRTISGDRVTSPGLPEQAGGGLLKRVKSLSKGKKRDGS